MSKATSMRIGHQFSLRNASEFGHRLLPGALTAFVVGVLIAVSGCQTTPTKIPITQPVVDSGEITLREGDGLKISFPGAPNLDTTQTIRRDGRITLPLGGEVTAANLTPAELEKEIITQYSSQLVSRQVTVTVLSSSLPVFVSGAVLRPGKILSDHPITALEAIMEAGGFDYTKADLSAVVVIRQEEGKTKNYTLNLRLVLQGKQSAPFYLRPSDIVFVPERFVWF